MIRVPRVNSLPVDALSYAVLGLLAAATTATSLAVSSAQWMGSWGETGAAIEDATIIGYPLVAGCAAWICSTPARKGFGQLILSSSRGRVELESRSVVALGFCASAGASIPALVAMVITARAASYGHAPLISVAVALIGYFACTAFGSLASKFLPSYFAAASSAAFLYVLQIFGDSGNPSLSFLAGIEVADSRERTYRETALWMISTRGVLLVAVAALLVAIAARSTRLASTAAAAACLIASPLLFVGADGMSIVPSSLQAICRTYDGEIHICMTAARIHTADSVHKYAARELRWLNGIGSGGITLEEVNLSKSGTVVVSKDGHITIPFEVANGVHGEAHVVNGDQLMANISTTLLRGNCRSAGGADASGRPIAQTVDVIEYWLMRKLGIETDGTNMFGAPPLDPDILDYSQVSTFQRNWEALDPNARTRWFSENRSDVIGCSVSPQSLT